MTDPTIGPEDMPLIPKEGLEDILGEIAHDLAYYLRRITKAQERQALALERILVAVRAKRGGSHEKKTD